MHEERATETAEPGGDRPEASQRPAERDALRLFVERTADYAMFVLDSQGYVRTWNRGAERIHRYEPGEIIGKHVSIFYPPDGLASGSPSRDLEIAAREGRCESEGWRVAKDGSPFWAHETLTALRDEADQLIGFGKVARDLTEQRRAEQQLRESEERFRLIIDSTLDYAIFMLDAGGYVVSWNPGAQRLKGYTATEIIGLHFSTFYTAEAVARAWPAYELAEAARVGRFEDEGWRVRKDGTQFWANVIITALRGTDGTLRGFGKVTRDMTERKAHEERIANLTRELERRVSELDAANRELAQRNAENESFVYSVSHDLRAPLVNLQGFSQELAMASDGLLRVLARPAVPEDVRADATALVAGELQESIGFIRNAVQHLGNIIDGLLRLSRVGRVEYESLPVDVAAVVADIVSAMHTMITTAGARVEVGALPVVRGDANAIGQVFANIIGNALKSFDADRPGVIEVFAREGTPPVFAVRDNGIGIPTEYRSKIFQVFQHVHRGRNRGEGMGLAIVRRIVERHGGRIWFESTPGVGTTFFFTLAPQDGAQRPTAREEA